MFKWIISKLESVNDFEFFTGHLKSNDVRRMERTLDQSNKESNVRTVWYQWIDQDNNHWYEVKVERDKYGQRDKVTVWRYNALNKLLQSL